MASRRVGGAVARNRAKRLLREAWRHHKEIVPHTGYELALVARSGCGASRYPDVERDLIAALGRAGFGSTAAVPAPDRESQA